MSKQETIDVLMAGYLSKNAALDDFNAVKATDADLIGLVILDKDLEGNVSIDVEDHAVRTGAKKLGGVGLVVGLFAPPLLAATAVGVVVGAGVGKVAHRKIEAGIKEGAQDAIPIGGAGLIVAYHPASGAAVEAAVTRAIKRGAGEATGSHKTALKEAMAAAQAKLNAV